MRYQSHKQAFMYHKKDKKAQIYKRHTADQDSAGFAGQEYYTPVAPASLWCYAKQLTQQQLYAAHAFWNDETRYFVFNYRDDVKQYDLVYYVNKQTWYEVTRVDTTDDYNGDVFVYVKNLPRPPKMDKVKPYGYKA